MEKNVINRRDFVRNTILGVAAVSALNGSLLSNSYASTVNKKQSILTGKWTNWGENISFTPKKIFTPRTIQEAIEVVKNNKKIRVVGSGHSFSTLVPAEVLLSTSMFKKITINKSAMWADIECGVILEELVTALKKENLALASTGDIDQQTVAGLVATGTRGTGANFASFSDETNLLGLSIIFPNGEYQEFDFQNSADQDLVKALRLNLGAFGVVTSVRFRICPTFNLEQKRIVTTLEEALKVDHVVNNYRYAFYYYPFSDSAIMRFQNLTNKTIATDEERKKRKSRENIKDNILANLLIDIASAIPSTIPWILKKFASNLKDESFIDTWDNVMMTKRTMKYVEMNYILPIENLPEAMKRCKAHVMRFADQKEFYLALPIYIRYAREDRGTLIAPSGESEGLYAHIDLNLHHAVKNYDGLLQALEKDFLELGGRPHWGKVFYSNPKRLYSNIDLFESLRKSVDPTDKFQNKFIKDYIST